MGQTAASRSGGDSLFRIAAGRVYYGAFGKGVSMLNRRSFLSSSLAVSAGLAFRGSLWAQLQSLPSKLPDHNLLDTNEDAYWAEMRKQFLIPADEVYLNNGTVGSSPATGTPRRLRRIRSERKARRGGSGGLSHLGLRRLERISRPAGRVRGLHPRRNRAAAQRHRGQ